MRAILISWALCLIGCAPTLQGPLDVPESTAASATLGHGYGLLLPVLQDESSATLIFGVKHGSPPLQALVRRISDASANAHRDLLAMLPDPPPLKAGSDGLPLIEVSTRNHMANQEAAGLLLAGKQFNRRMILAQQKACAYIAALADTLSKADPNAERSALMAAVAREFSQFDGELRDMLTTAEPSVSVSPS
ncbi:MAG: hypothetical protein QF733_00115 [Phycisphaerales bacterium]|jgi:hypothetical protein|nr:hypothetical protein [Phycisphaerales bacterium]